MFTATACTQGTFYVETRFGVDIGSSLGVLVALVEDPRIGLSLILNSDVGILDLELDIELDNNF